MRKVEASLLPGGTHFRLAGRVWSMTDTIDRLDHWIAFYKRMTEREPNRSLSSPRKVYGPTYAALKVLKAQVAS